MVLCEEVAQAQVFQGCSFWRQAVRKISQHQVVTRTDQPSKALYTTSTYLNLYFFKGKYSSKNRSHKRYRWWKLEAGTATNYQPGLHVHGQQITITTIISYNLRMWLEVLFTAYLSWMLSLELVTQMFNLLYWSKISPIDRAYCVQRAQYFMFFACISLAVKSVKV